MNDKNCKIGKHKLRENNFGVVWCINCGMLSNTTNAIKLDKKEILIYQDNSIKR